MLDIFKSIGRGLKAFVNAFEDPKATAVTVLGLLGIALGLVVVWEAYTGTMRLGRVETEIELLGELQELREHPSFQEDTVLTKTYEGLRRELRQSVRERPDLEVGGIALSKQSIQGITTSLPWLGFLLLVFSVPTLRPEEGTAWQLVLGIAFVAIPHIVAGALLLPTTWPWWLNLLVYPFGGFAVIVWLVNFFWGN